MKRDNIVKLKCKNKWIEKFKNYGVCVLWNYFYTNFLKNRIKSEEESKVSN